MTDGVQTVGLVQGSYNALESFRGGQVGSGIAVGGSHIWTYDPGTGPVDNLQLEYQAAGEHYLLWFGLNVIVQNWWQRSTYDVRMWLTAYSLSRTSTSIPTRRALADRSANWHTGRRGRIPGLYRQLTSNVRGNSKLRNARKANRNWIACLGPGTRAKKSKIGNSVEP